MPIRKLTAEDVEEIRALVPVSERGRNPVTARFTRRPGPSFQEIGERYGVAASTVENIVYRRRWNGDKVPVDGLRDAFLASGLTPGEVARRLDWMRYKGKNGHRYIAGDDTRVLRALGLRPSFSRGSKSLHEYISRTNALAIAEAIGVDPVDVGL